MPSKRTDLVLEPETMHSPANLSPSSFSSSPPMTATSISPTSTRQQTDVPNAVRLPTRSITWDSLLARARSKSPRPHQPDNQVPSPPLHGRAPLHHSRTTPITPTSTAPRPPYPQQRHKSDSAIQSHLTRESSTDSTFFQKRPKQQGSLDHYGRHGNDWLFGGISFRETAKGLVQKRRES